MLGGYTGVLRKGAATALIALTGIGAVAGTPQTASAAPKVKSHVVFNNPLSPEGAKNIQKRTVKLIKGAKRGSKIRISVYRFSNAYDVSDALIAAYRRGVDIKIVADKGAAVRTGPDYAPTGFERVRDVIGADRAVLCPHACIGEKLNHTKFLLFSNTRNTPDVVMQTSQNLNATGGTTTDWNDAVVLANAPGTYNAYMRYFNDLWARKPMPNYWRKRGGAVSSPEATVQFFPKATGDPMAKIFRQVQCVYTAGGKSATTHVRIAMGAINSKRDEVVGALTALRKKGCAVEVIDTVDPADATRTVAAATLRNAGIKLYEFGEYTSPNPMHSKYVLIAGKLAGKPGKYVWTGSANFTWGSLRQDDESVIQLKRLGTMGPAKIHAKYLCNFVRARAQAVGKPVPKPTCK